MVKLCCPYLHSFGHTPRPPAPCRRYDLPGVGGLASSADRCSVPSVRALSCLAWSVLVLALHALLPAVRSRSGCAGVGRGAPEGHIGNAGGGAGESRHHRKNKKRLKKLPHPYCQSQKFPAKTKKTPTKGLRSVLYLPYKP